MDLTKQINALDWSLLDKQLGLLRQSLNLPETRDALPYLVIGSLLGLTNEEIGDTITDGGGDRGVDAFYLDEREQSCTLNIYNFKYFSKVEKSRTWFPTAEVDKIISFIEDFVNKSTFLKQSCHPQLAEKIDYAWEQYIAPNFRIRILLCGNCGPLVDDQSKRLASALGHYRFVEIIEYPLKEIVDRLIRQTTGSVNGRIQLLTDQYFERSDGKYRGLIATVEAAELIKLTRDPIDANKLFEPVFNDNIRVYLGDKNYVNAEIFRTATSETSRDFWYLNNGVTIVCQRMAYNLGVVNPVVDLENFQIVNGGQTTNAIFEAMKVEPNRTKNVFVLIRIYETRDETIKLRIAAATNTQTPIKARDLRANDPIQLRLEQSLRLQGYWYDRKRLLHQDKNEEEKIDALRAGQTMLAYYGGQPDKAKTQSNRIFGDQYDEIFNGSVTAEKLLCAYLLARTIEGKKIEIKKQLRMSEKRADAFEFLIEGMFHVLYVVGLLCNRDKVDLANLGEANKRVEEAIQISSDVANRYRHRSFYKFFRSTEAKEILRDAVFDRQSRLL